MSTPVEIAPRIVVNPDVMSGTPVIAGTRITVELVLRELSMGATPSEIVASYPTLTEEGIRAACAYGAKLVASDRVFVAAE